MASGNVDIATVLCPICHADLPLVAGDIPMGLRTVNEHFAETGCNNPLTFDTPTPE